MIFIDEQGWSMSRPQAQGSQSVGGVVKGDINHVFSMLLTFGAIGRLALRQLRSIPYRDLGG